MSGRGWMSASYARASARLLRGKQSHDAGKNKTEHAEM